MSELPKGWLQVAFEDVAEINPRKSVDLEPNETVTFVPMAAVNEVSGTIVEGVSRPLHEVNRGFTQFADGDVIFAKITPSMENGKSAVARGLENGVGFGSTEFHVFRSYGAVLPEFLWLFVRQKKFREDARKVMSGAVGQQRVPTEYLKAHSLPLPPITEQKRIVAKVGSMTDRTTRARSHLDCILVLLEEYKNRLLNSAFSEGLLGGKKNWRSTTVGDVVETQLGKMLDRANNKGEPTRYLRNFNVRWFEFELRDIFEMPMTSRDRERYDIQDGDVLVCEGGEPGRSAVWEGGSTELAFQKALIRVRPKSGELDPNFFAYFMRYAAINGTLEQYFTGTTIRHLPQRALKRVLLSLPPFEEQKQIVQRLKGAFRWLDRISIEHAAASGLLPELDAAILSKAFGGRLVSQNQNDEPASRLLERIIAQRETAREEPRRRQSSARSLATIERKPPMANLIDVLKSKDGWVSAREAAQELGIGDGSTSDAVEEFYHDLRSRVLEGSVVVERRDDEDWLRLHPSQVS